MAVAVTPDTGCAATTTTPARPKKATPKSKPIATSPHLTRTHMPMRKAPLSPRAVQGSAMLGALCAKAQPSESSFPHPYPGLPLSPTLYPHPAAVALRRRQVDNVIKRRKYHQHQHDRETDAETDLLGPLGERPAAHRFNPVEQKVTAIEERNGKEIEQPDRDRKHRGQVKKRDEAHRRHLSRHLRDADRAAELVCGLAPDDNAADVAQRPFDHEPCFLNAHPDGPGRRNRLQLHV